MARLFILAALLLLAFPSRAATLTSYTGTLGSPTDTFEIAVALSDPGSITLQTFGFGGGTNGAGTVIPAGGFDPLIALFSGTGPTAVLIDGTADTLTNYPAFSGCPPAGLTTIGSFTGQCGDITMQFAGLAAGTYTVLLSDAAYIPLALFTAPPGTLGDGFADLTAGVFQTCTDSDNCREGTANWALDITLSGASADIPEPASFYLIGFGLAACALTRAFRS